MGCSRGQPFFANRLPVMRPTRHMTAGCSFSRNAFAESRTLQSTRFSKVVFNVLRLRY